MELHADEPRMVGPLDDFGQQPVGRHAREDQPLPLERDVREALRQVDARLPFVGFEPMSAVVARDLDVPRFLTTMLAAFAGLAVTLTLGIIASFFTAVYITKTFFLIYLSRKRAADPISI